MNNRSASGANRYELLFAGFMALFVTFVVLTNTVGVKLFTVLEMTLPVSIILGVYLAKVAIAAVDTPLCYLAVWWTRRFTRTPAP